jgi:hypothetical protein
MMILIHVIQLFHILLHVPLIILMIFALLRLSAADPEQVRAAGLTLWRVGDGEG